MRKLFELGARVIPIMFILLGDGYGQQQSVVETVHNLSASGRGAIRSTREAEVCIFCHTPHAARQVAPLWNRSTTMTVFEVYPSGGSMRTEAGQPSGSSLLCLSCHDGTVALGFVQSRGSRIPLQGTAPDGLLPPGRSNLRTVLWDDHPVSVPVDPTDPELLTPESGGRVRLDNQGLVQCTSCHDVHRNSYGHFLLTPNTQSDLCLTCHRKHNWGSSVHGNPLDPQYRLMLDLACGTCHRPHHAPIPRQLLKERGDVLCFTCHDGTIDSEDEVPARYDMKYEFQKSARHPIELNPEVHDPGEGLVNSFPEPSAWLPEIDPNAERHVVCADCHNPHSSLTRGTSDDLDGSLEQVWGLSSETTRIEAATREYQICYKCHSESRNLPPGATNKRLEFSPLNPSFHPVEDRGRNEEVPSLLSPLTEGSMLDCSDCHTNDDPQGPVGPHGSIYEYILVARYSSRDREPDDTAFLHALCYRCHDINSILGDESFPTHKDHIVSEQASCFACHDAHGSRQYGHLIRFDLEVCGPSGSGRLEYIDGGSQKGSCYVKCHGINHDPKNY